MRRAAAPSEASRSRTFAWGSSRVVPASAHAGGVRFAETLVVLLVVPDAVERAAAGAHQAADQRAFAGALATPRDGATGCADRGAPECTDAGCLAHVQDVVGAFARRVAGLGRRLLVTRVHRLLRGHAGAPRGRRSRGRSHG